MRELNRNTLAAGVALAALMCGSYVHAGLIGGSLELSRASDFGSGLVFSDIAQVDPIAADSSDQTQFGTGGDFMTFDAGSDGFTFDFASAAFDDIAFDGFRVDRLQWADGPRRITGVSVVEDIDGFDAGDVSHTGGSVTIDLAGLTIAGQSIDISLSSVLSPFGDLNRDGVVDLSDASPFMRSLLRADPFDIAADMDGNGLLDARDIEPFVQILRGQRSPYYFAGTTGDASKQPAATPTPTAAGAAVAIGLLGLLRRRRAS